MQSKGIMPPMSNTRLQTVIGGLSLDAESSDALMFGNAFRRVVQLI